VEDGGCHVENMDDMKFDLAPLCFLEGLKKGVEARLGAVYADHHRAGRVRFGCHRGNAAREGPESRTWAGRSSIDPVAAIEVKGLVKRYGELAAVDGVELSVEPGEVFALLGPNGAGKTTTVEILEGHRDADQGQVSVLGFDPSTGGRAHRERIGIVLQEGAVERELTVREALTIYGGMYPRRLSPAHLVELVGLEEKADARIKTLSGGQQRRLELALGLAGDPDLLFLDEPTTGFDPSARRQAWGILENLTALGKTILLTTHYMDEAQHLADRIAVIDHGRIVAEGTPETLGGRADGKSVIRFALPSGVGADQLPIPARVREGIVEVDAESVTKALHGLTSWAVERGLELDRLQVTRPSLEDVYLELTGDS
jgi:ABC-2 type transport system ATP-binding protein